MYQKYPKAGSVKINDGFWTPYLENVRNVMMPYVFNKLEENDFLTNFYSVIDHDGAKHIGRPFSDGLLYESLRGACDFLADRKDVVLEAYVDKLIEIITSAQDEDGFICTKTMQNYPDKRWGDNDGDIVVQHDLYDHGCLIEAAISHYNATGKTALLGAAVKAANLIVKTIGRPPKKNIIPGHSLPEEAFVKLYRLFRDDAGLKGLAEEYGVRPEEYLDIAEFWYDARGDHEGRFLCKRFLPYYNQDHVTFSKQTEAVGHSVRAMLCYLGATVVAQEKNREDFFETLNSLWDNVVNKKLHISGGIGSRHDIEGFDEDYKLPNKAYLETCAAIGLAFWNTELNIVSPDSKYFDCFERSLYNNILSAVGGDFRHFFYQNPLESDGKLQRWEWHDCPCCPPMLLKIFSALGSFIYSYGENSLNVNMFIGSSFENGEFSVRQSDGTVSVDSKGKKMTLRIRIPEYAENFSVSENHKIENGYAVLEGVWSAEKPIEVKFDTPVRRVFCNPKVMENHGKVAVTHGPFIMCAEGFDNGGSVDAEISADPKFEITGETVRAKTSGKADLVLIPYYKWCNRGEKDADRTMAVWLRQLDMRDPQKLSEEIGGKLYGIY
ncbi:MAG: glycoside hydrolase family 127 protein [Clostridia bacterium]|nr:glycoside hydrolase family 127 protein [Clostridia bacterium]